MVVTLNDTEYRQLRENKSMKHLKTVYSDDGVHRYLANYFGGNISIHERFTAWGESTEVKQCAKCNEFHDKNSPPLCFGCAMNLK